MFRYDYEYIYTNLKNRGCTSEGPDEALLYRLAKYSTAMQKAKYKASDHANNRIFLYIIDMNEYLMNIPRAS